jgi:hypothetical protein
VLPPSRRWTPGVRPPPWRTPSHRPHRRSPPESGRSPSVRRRSPHVHRRRTSPRRWRSRLGHENRSRCDLLSVDLAPIHVLHSVFGVVRVRELHVAKAASQMLVNVVFGKVHVLDWSIGAENFHDVVFVDGSSEPADVDLGGTGGGRTAPPLPPVRPRPRSRFDSSVVLVVTHW